MRQTKVAADTPSAIPEMRIATAPSPLPELLTYPRRRLVMSSSRYKQAARLADLKPLLVFRRPVALLRWPVTGWCLMPSSLGGGLIRRPLAGIVRRAKSLPALRGRLLRPDVLLRSHAPLPPFP